MRGLPNAAIIHSDLSVIERTEFDEVYRDMREDGFPMRPADEAYRSFTDKRLAYASHLDALAVLLAAPPGRWIGDRSVLGARTAHVSGTTR